MKKSLLIILIYTLFISSYSKVMAYDEAKYDVIKKNEIYEIRKYFDRLVVQSISKNGDNSFRKLFGYISGQNENSEKIKMTTPVTQIRKKNKITMQFFLPTKFNKNNIPNPTRSDIEIINVEGGFYAVIQYSGRATDKNFDKHIEILKNVLLDKDISIIGPEIKATYDSPFTLPMLRRNEAMFKISWK
jgi:hypothetical protein